MTDQELIQRLSEHAKECQQLKSRMNANGRSRSHMEVTKFTTELDYQAAAANRVISRLKVKAADSTKAKGKR